MEENYGQIVDLQDNIIIISNPIKREIVSANKSFINFFNISLDEFKEKYSCICNKFEASKKDYLLPVMPNGEYWIDYILKNPTLKIRVLMKDSNEYFYHFSIEVKKIDTDKFAVIFNNITDIVVKEQELESNLNLLNEYKKIVDNSTIVSKTDKYGIINYVNNKFCEISGYTREELIGKPHNMIRHPEMSKKIFSDLWNTIKNGKTWNGVVKNKRKDGGFYIVSAVINPIMDKNREIIEYIAIRKDITEEYLLKEELKEYNKKIQADNENLNIKANTDKLTNIFNRHAWDSILETNIIKALSVNEDLSLFMLDIDNFKKINDTKGHQAGDIILTKIAALVNGLLRSGDVLARYGGEEFIVLLPKTNLKTASIVAEKVRKNIFMHTFENIGKITASFGVSTLTDVKEKEDINEILKEFVEKADKNLYEAKKNGKNKVVY